MSTPTAAYYATFKRRYGFADDVMRGQSPTLVVAGPVGDYVDGDDSGKFARGMRPGREPSARPRVAAHVRQVMERAGVAEAALEDLRLVVTRVRSRIAIQPNAAVRDALGDAENILRGLDPVAKGAAMVEVLRSLVRVLSRHA